MTIMHRYNQNQHSNIYLQPTLKMFFLSTTLQTLFVTCGICILFRKGVLTFVGNLVSIRLLRIALIGSPTRVADRRDDQTNELNLAI